MGVCVSTCLKDREDLWELVLSFYHVDPQDQTQVISLGGKLLYFQSHVVGPRIINFYKWLFQMFFDYFQESP